MRKKWTLFLLTALVMALCVVMPAFAGEWKQNDVGWWYDNGDGTYPVNTWSWIDGNHDGVAECYYFDNNGYCLLNTTTPDGYFVDGDGAWVENGIKQQKQTESGSQTADVSKDTKKLDIQYGRVKQSLPHDVNSQIDASMVFMEVGDFDMIELQGPQNAVSWESKDPLCVYVVGNGNFARLHAISNGITQVYCYLDNGTRRICGVNVGYAPYY